MMDKHALQTPGEVLSAARRQRSLTVAQVAEKTKIPPAMVAAVEADEYQKISGPIYVRSFLRTIAQAVGADAERILELYAGMAGQEGGSGAGEAQIWDSEEVVVQRLGFSWQPWMLYVAVALVVVVALGLFLRGCGGESSSVDQGSTAVVAEPAATGTVSDSLAAGAAVPATETERAPAAVPCRTGVEEVVFATAAEGDLVLAVEADQVVNVSVRTDGHREFLGADWSGGGQGIPDLPDSGIVPGRVYRCGGKFIVYWHAADHFGLKLGDPAGVAVFLQGRPYSLAGVAAGQEIILDRHSIDR